MSTVPEPGVDRSQWERLLHETTDKAFERLELGVKSIEHTFERVEAALALRDDVIADLSQRVADLSQRVAALEGRSP